MNIEIVEINFFLIDILVLEDQFNLSLDNEGRIEVMERFISEK